MEKDLNSILKMIGTEILINTRSKQINDFIQYFINTDEDMDIARKFHGYTISEIVCLIRIERLFDLHLITKEEKELLLKEYQEYRSLSLIIRNSFVNKLLNEKEEEIDENIRLREKELFIKLNQLGILEDIDYTDAMMHEIDKRLKQKVKRLK